MRARLLFGLGLSAAAGCGLTFSPGDFSVPDEAGAPPADATFDGNVVIDGGGPGEASSETGTTAPAAHIVVFAGTKEGGSTNDVWLTSVAASGDIAPFEYLPSTPLLRPLQAVANAGGRVLTIAQGTSSRVVQSATFSSGIASPWTTAVVPSSPTTAYGTFFARQSVVVVGGQTTEDTVDGEGNPIKVTTNRTELLVNRASGAQYPPPNNVASGTKLPTGIYDPTTVVYKDFLFLWGAGTASDQRSKVYVGKVDETLGLASVTATAAMVGQDGTAHTPAAPIACAGEGRLFVLGGAGADVVISADIDEATGMLGTWKSGATLPASRTGGACVVVKGAIYVIGGRAGDAELFDTVLRARISAGGELSEWEALAQRLPGPRANVFALTY